MKTMKYYEHDVLTYQLWPKNTFQKIAGCKYENLLNTKMEQKQALKTCKQSSEITII
ncbi:unnamed protein product [Paramecium pentaurelia]|uniref:Uncharacterized protein n=1 Tax=Paramecium pentaurelia TaxID=43138 RepID=A0A8S1X998_9CILI|nr:unnamed protein product [Paramecium pentaurelia]